MAISPDTPGEFHPISIHSVDLASLLLINMDRPYATMSRPRLQASPLLLTLFCFLCFSALRAEVAVIDVEVPPRFAGPTPEFFAAAASGDLAQLQRSLDEGVSVDAPVPSPPSAELTALFKPHSLGIRLVNAPGATALMFATVYGRADAMTALIAAKANVEARTHAGLRPLDLAAERGDIPAMQMLLGVTPASEAAHLSIVVDLDKQNAVLSRDGQPVLTTKVSSGKKEKPTPPGKYVVTQKYTEWRSTLYHNAKMPFFLRLSCSPVGLHAGVIPGYPASHGCVRLPPEVAHKLYDIVPKGTPVEIRSSALAEPTAKSSTQLKKLTAEGQ